MFFNGCGRGGGSGAEADVASGASFAGQSVRVVPVSPRRALEIEMVFHWTADSSRETRWKAQILLSTKSMDKAGCSITATERNREVSQRS